MSVLHSLVIAALLVPVSPSYNAPADHNSLMIFAAGPNDPMAIQEERQLDADIPGMSDRDILVTVVTESSDPELYRETVGESKGFALVLFGKSGKKLYQANKLVSREVIYRVVDGAAAGRKAPVDELKKGARD